MTCGCGTAVLVEKFSDEHTSVQWPARTVCPQLTHDQEPGGWQPTCGVLHAKIDEEIEAGRIPMTYRQDPSPIRFDRSGR
ncbi:hypothetical protein DW322_20850 [Rhodococcus rhodnii]|uniref:Uncharacterized protein n=1 Tax=Rhodococcus rhodnii TaxID=38312 RepID=A0A6P2CK56_9NOCA|nr:hypothetical protein DW322_20850 [Rhodococcus rhodnii]